MTLSEYLNMLFPFFGDREGFGQTPKTKKGRGKADFVTAVFKIFCKCAKRGTQRISRARGLRLRACANAATASAAWPWQVAGEMLKWGTDGRPMKVLIPVTVGTISIAFSRRSVKAGVERTLSLRPRMVNRRSACQDT